MADSRHTVLGPVLAIVSLLAIVVCGSAGAQQSATPSEAQRNPAQIVLFQQHPEEYKGGRQLAVTVYISAFSWDGLTAMGLYETVPAGWTYGGARAITGTMPGVTPKKGDSGVLQFLWIEQSTTPITFQYVLNIPAQESGARFISGQVEYRHGEGALTSNVAFSQMNGVADALPIITLRGASVIKISLNGTFNDPGATATDAEDGDLSSRIEVAGDVDSNTPGSYTLTYGVVDSVGNHAVPVSRQVVVSDSPSEPGGGVPGGEKPDPPRLPASIGHLDSAMPSSVADPKPVERPKFPNIVIPEVNLHENKGDYVVPLSTEGDHAGESDTTPHSSDPRDQDEEFRIARAATTGLGASGGIQSAAAEKAAELSREASGRPVVQTPWVLVGVGGIMAIALGALWQQARNSGRRRG